ncbi:MAG: hypothetical protein Q9221_006399 [Calogaya cf. arnoldii]
MGKRKRPLSHKSKRTRATNPSGGLLKQNHNAQQRIPFMDLPPEIRDAVLQDLRLRGLAVLVLTTKAVRAYVEPFLYKKIYTRRNTPHDTKGLINLLQRRGHIAPMIHILVLDEYHPRHMRRLLSIEMPHLSTLLIQHEEWSVADVSEREKRALNRDVVIQPNIKRQPALLLGPHKGFDMYKTSEFLDLIELLRNRLPPNIKQLLLRDGISPISLSEPESESEDEIERLIYDKDLELMRCLLEHKEYVAPCMTRLYMYFLCNMYEPHPVHLYELAERVGVMLSERYANDNLEEVDFQWLDSNEDDGPRSYDELVLGAQGIRQYEYSLMRLQGY